MTESVDYAKIFLGNPASRSNGAGGSDEEPASPADVFESRLVSFDDMEHRPPPTYLVDRMLVRDSLAVIFGPPGIGKSFLLYDIGAHVATGAWWQGRRVTAGQVLCIAAEGVGGSPQRVAAWKKANRVHEVPGFVIYPGAVNLLDADQVFAVVEVCRRRQFAMVAIDTVARSMPGADENSAKDMGLLIMAADHIRSASGSCVLLVHHTGKDVTAGMRGSSSLEGAADTAIEVSGGEGGMKVACRKQKDAGPFTPLDLSLEVVDVTVSGVETTSCAVAGRLRTNRIPEGRADEAEGVLVHLMSSAGLAGTAVRDAIEDRLGVKRTTAYELINMLVGRGLLRNTGTDNRPFYVLGGES